MKWNAKSVNKEMRQYTIDGTQLHTSYPQHTNTYKKAKRSSPLRFLHFITICVIYGLINSTSFSRMS